MRTQNTNQLEKEDHDCKCAYLQITCTHAHDRDVSTQFLEDSHAIDRDIQKGKHTDTQQDSTRTHKFTDTQAGRQTDSQPDRYPCNGTDAWKRGQHTDTQTHRHA
jgi:hypothetical protein